MYQIENPPKSDRNPPPALVSALGPVAPNAASKVGGAMVEACRIRQGPAHFTRPPVACRFAPIVWVPS